MGDGGKVELFIHLSSCIFLFVRCFFEASSGLS